MRLHRFFSVVVFAAAVFTPFVISCGVNTAGLNDAGTGSVGTGTAGAQGGAGSDGAAGVAGTAGMTGEAGQVGDAGTTGTAGGAGGSAGTTGSAGDAGTGAGGSGGATGGATGGAGSSGAGGVDGTGGNGGVGGTNGGGGVSGSSGAGGAGGSAGAGGTGAGGTGGANACQEAVAVDRKCTNDTDCVAVMHTTNCCGAAVWLGINASVAEHFSALEKLCDASYPACGCAAGPPVADDGSIIPLGEAAGVTCDAGTCKTFSQLCGHACDNARTCLTCGPKNAEKSVCSLRCTTGNDCTDPSYTKCQPGLGGSVCEPPNAMCTQ
jgi:hypothetical protein